MRAALIGVGFGGAVAFPALRANPSVEVTAVCSANLDNARRFARENAIPLAVDDIDDLVGRDDVDLVLVCTPPLLHAPFTRRALEAGHHVFSTKPLAPSVEEAQALRNIARETGVVTSMDLDNRYMPVRRHMRALVRDGYLGDLRCVVGTVFWGLATDPSTRIHYWGWTSLRDQSGGMLGASLLLHHVDLLRYTFGEVVSVGGLATTLITEKPVLAPGQSEWSGLSASTPTVGTRAVDAEDMVVLHGKLAQGGVFSLTGSWSIHHGSGIRVEAYGSAGTLVLDAEGVLHGAKADEPALRPLTVPPELGGQHVAASNVARFGLLFNDVVDAIRGTATDPLFATFEDGFRVREIAASVIPPP